MFKNTLSIYLIFLFSFSFAFSAGKNEIETANFLAWKSIIADNSNSPSLYRVNDTITRKETMKIVMKLSWLTIEDKCEWKFSDVLNDWWCKYIEAWLKAWFITQNEFFRPNDNITKTESMKLILKAKWIKKIQETEEWQKDYMETAYKYWIIDTKYYNYDIDSKRGWIFITATLTIEKEEEIKVKQLDNEYPSKVL